MPPEAAFGDHWVLQLDTAEGTVGPLADQGWDAGTEHDVPAHSMVVLSTAVVPRVRAPGRRRAGPAGRAAWREAVGEPAGAARLTVRPGR